MSLNEDTTDVQELDEVQDLFTQLAELRKSLESEESKEAGKEKLKARIHHLFEEAEQTNQEFKDIPTSVQVNCIE